MSSIVPVFIPHIGCPHDCAFCNQRSISQTKTAPAKEQVFSLVKTGLELSPGGQVAFYGGSFTAINWQLQSDYLSAAINAGAQSIRLSTRPDYIDTKALQFLKEHRVQVIEIGAQSMCDEVLAASRRGHTAQHITSAAQLIKQAGFTLIIQMMTGLPLDTAEKSAETAKKIAALEPDGVRIYPTVVIENTHLHTLYLAREYTPLELDLAVEICAEVTQTFEAQGISVIRTGLNTFDKHSLGSVVAGPYHPAFGELVKSRIYYHKITKILENNTVFKEIILEKQGSGLIIRAGSVPQVIGQKRENIEKLKAKFGFEWIKVEKI